MMMSLLAIVTANAGSFLLSPDSRTSILDLSEPGTLYLVPLDDPRLDLSRFTVAAPEGDPLSLTALYEEMLAFDPEGGDTLELASTADGSLEAWFSSKVADPRKCSAVYQRRCIVHRGGVSCWLERVGEICCTLDWCGNEPLILP
jgi:hypothetical protein